MEVRYASIFNNLVRAVVWIFALLSVLEPVFNIQPTAFVAALGVTGVAISLGLQDTISNVIGGISLMAGEEVGPEVLVSSDAATGRAVLFSHMASIHVSRYSELPRLDLYLDQLLTLVQEELSFMASGATSRGVSSARSSSSAPALVTTGISA